MRESIYATTDVSKQQDTEDNLVEVHIKSRPQTHEISVYPNDFDQVVIQSNIDGHAHHIFIDVRDVPDFIDIIKEIESVISYQGKANG